LFKALAAVERFIRTLLGVAVVSLLGFGGWLGYQAVNGDKVALEKAQKELDNQRKELAESKADVDRLTQVVEVRNKEIGELKEDVKAKQRQIQKLDTAVRLLKVDQRVARIEVLDQKGAVKDGDLTTTFNFAELNAKGQPIEPPRVFKVKGDMVYVDAWIVKFDDRLIESGDADHPASVCLFRRIFGESQQPKDGFVLDPVGSSPMAYRAGRDMTDFEREIWSRFWDYANDSNLAGERGIRAAHGEAPFMKLTLGKRYRVTLRASGGLTIVPEDKAPPKPGETM
jgi:cell division protein FtsB